MRAVLFLIAMIFAFGAVAGQANGHALAYTSAPVSIAVAVEQCVEPIDTVAVTYKLCGKKQSGLVLPCTHTGVLVSVAPALPEAHEAGADLPCEATGDRPGFGVRLLRPPIAA